MRLKLMQELVFAALVGLSLGHSWLCLFMAFGMSTVELRTGMWFLLGRAVGLILLGALIVFAGMFLELSPKAMQGAAGVLAVAFGAVLIAQHQLSAKKRKHKNSLCEHGHKHKHKQEHKHKHGDGSGNGCGKNHWMDAKKLETGKNKQVFGFGLGVFRGVTPCFKIIVLAPLLIVVSVPNALAMVLVFTVVSMVYPVIGYLSASTLHNFVRNRDLLMIAGAVVLILIGIYYIYESVIPAGVHIPGSGGGV
jgi:ABC-type nickel/cobalt efflux system permease component RcnA